MEEKIVTFIKKPVVFRSIYFVSCMVASFGFGVFTHYSIINQGNAPAVILPEQPVPLALRYKNQTGQNPYDYLPAQTTPDESTPVGGDLSQKSSTRFNFVASKTGTKYYPVDCGSVDRIKPENRVYFETEQEAKEKGYERTAACQ